MIVGEVKYDIHLNTKTGEITTGKLVYVPKTEPKRLRKKK